MNLFTEEIYAVENRARKCICDKLDEVEEIVLWTREMFVDEEETQDALVNIPTQPWQDDYTTYWYRLIRIYKDNEGYFAEGFDEQNDLTYDLNLFEEVDAFQMAELADIIRKKYDKVQE